MDEGTNLVVLAGRLTGPVLADERRGRSSARFTVAVTSPGPPRRVDALPVTWWDPPNGFAETAVGTTLVVVGTLRRRFWATSSGRTSRLDVVATRVDCRSPQVDGAGVVASLPRPCP